MLRRSWNRLVQTGLVRAHWKRISGWAAAREVHRSVRPRNACRRREYLTRAFATPLYADVLEDRTLLSSPAGVSDDSDAALGQIETTAAIGQQPEFMRLSAIEGLYYDDGQTASVLRYGARLTFVNGAGETSNGNVLSATQVVAADWNNQTADFDPETGELQFADGTTWQKVRQLGGAWLNAIGRETSIRQLGTELTFTNYFGLVSSGHFDGPNRLIATDWGNVGTLSSDGQRIEWANGVVWDLIPQIGGNWSNVAGEPTRLEQLGASLVFVNRSGLVSSGKFLNATQVEATGWNNVGTLRNGTVEWANGAVWSPQDVGVRPYLAGLWDVAGFDVRVLQAGETLTFINRSGLVSRGAFVSDTQVQAIDWGVTAQLVGDQVRWSNGIVWTRIPDVGGTHITQDGGGTEIRQLERALSFTNIFGQTWQSRLTGSQNVVPIEPAIPTATITGGTLTFSNGRIWQPVSSIHGNWSNTSEGAAPAYSEQLGLNLFFISHTGQTFRGQGISPSAITTTLSGTPGPFVAASLQSGPAVVFDNGWRWERPVVTPLTVTLALDTASDPNGDLIVTQAAIVVVGQVSQPGATVRLDEDDDGAFDQQTVADEDGRYEFQLTVPLGDTLLRVLAQDQFGQQETAEILVTFNGQAPEVLIVSPPPGQFTRTNPTIQGKATSSGPAVQSVQVQIDNEEFVEIPFDEAGNFSFTTALLLDGSADGTHVVRFRAIDEAANVSALASLTFTLDTIAPEIPVFDLSVTSDTGEQGDQTTEAARVTITGHTEPGAVLTLVQTGATALANTSGAFFFPSVDLTLGDNLLTVVARDKAGNTSESSQTFVRIAATGAVVDPVLEWNRAAIEAIRLDADTPPEATRGLAILHSAILDVVNAIEGTPGRYVSLPAPAGASAEAAVAAAAHRVLSYLYPAQQASFDASLTTSLSRAADGSSKTDGIALGRAVADALIEIRSSDGFDAFGEYFGGTAPGQWQPTAPMFAPALQTQWGNVQPFVVADTQQFFPDGPPELTSQEWADAYNEIKAIGKSNSTTRTAEQTQIARFWTDGAGTYTPPGHWNQIAEIVSQSQGNSLAENARLFAQLNVALADAAIVCWDIKYTEGFWRPITAIQNGDVDGNDQTEADPGWVPLLVTPPFPEYVSGHSTFSGAAAAILTAYFGDDVGFTVGSFTPQSFVRSFVNFDQAAEEAANSRLYGGIHYRFSNADGLAVGRELAQYVLQAFSSSQDTQPPAIILDAAPAASADNITLTGQILDNLAGLQAATIQIDDNPAIALLLDAQGRFSFPTTFATDGSEDGLRVFHFEATDAAGNITTRDLLFTLDTSAPTVEIDSLSEGGELLDGARLTGIADGTGSAIVSLTYQFDDGTIMPFSLVDVGVFDTALDLSRLATGAHTLVVSASDAAGNSSETTLHLTLPELATFNITSVTPTEGSEDVGVTYRPQVFFSRPVDISSLNDSNFFATDTTGAVVPATIVPSADGSFAWLFFDASLPGASTITMHVDGSTIRADGDGAALDADGDGTAGGEFTWKFSTVSLAGLPGTTLVGTLADPGPDLKMGTFDDVRPGPDGVLMTADDVYLRPIEHVKIFIIGLEDQGVFTDAQGRFELHDIPAGHIKVVVDGRTATNPPAGYYFPEMVMDLDIRPGEQNTMMAAMQSIAARAQAMTEKGVYLPRLALSLLNDVSNTAPTTVGVDALSAPDLTPEDRQFLTLTVQPGSILGFDGKPLANPQIGISTVPPEMVQDMLPPGLREQHTFEITIQAPGASVFQEPVQITFPNYYNAAPGTQVNIFSFDHTTGLTVLDGTGTVSADGEYVVSDPGSGIRAPGWHFVQVNTDFAGMPCTDSCLIVDGQVGEIIEVHFPDELLPAGATAQDWKFTPTGGGLFFDTTGSRISSTITLGVERIVYFLPDILKPSTSPSDPGLASDGLGVFSATLIDAKNRKSTASGNLRVRVKQGWSPSEKVETDVSKTVTELIIAQVRQRLRYLGYHDRLASKDAPDDPNNASLLSLTWGKNGPADKSLSHAIGVFNAAARTEGIVNENSTSLETAINSVNAPRWVEVQFGNGIKGSNQTKERHEDFISSWALQVLTTANGSLSSELSFGGASTKGGGNVLRTVSHGGGIDIDIHTIPATNAGDPPFYKTHPLNSETLIAAVGELDPKGDSHIIVKNTDGTYQARRFTGVGTLAAQAQDLLVTSAGHGLRTGDRIWFSAGPRPAQPFAVEVLDNGRFLAKGALNSVGGTGSSEWTLADVPSNAVRHKKVTPGAAKGTVDDVDFLRAISKLIADAPGYKTEEVTKQIDAFREQGKKRVAEIFYNDPRQWTEMRFPGKDTPYDGVVVKFLEGHAGHFHVNTEFKDDTSDAVKKAQPQLADASPNQVSAISTASGFGDDPRLFYRFQFDSGFTFGGRSDQIGNLSLTLPPNAVYALTVYQASTNSSAGYHGRTNGSGEVTLLGAMELNQFGGLDTDGDGLPDVGELAIGTSSTKVDTDGDGITDAAEIEQGLDPLDDRGFLVAQLDLPGTATDVAVAPELGLAALATNGGGLQIIDISQPTNSRVVRTVDLPCGRVEILDGIAYVASDESVVSIDLVTGKILQTLNLGGAALTDISAERGMLYTMDASRVLRAIDVSDLQMTPRGIVGLPAGGTKLFVGGGVAYAAADEFAFLPQRAGFATADVSDPDHLQFLGYTTPADFRPGTSIAANGSGIALLAGTSRPGPGFSTPRVLIMDVRDPSKTDEVLLGVNLPTSPQGVAIASGIAFIADGFGGLQIVNYLPFDSQEQPPTVSLFVPEAADVDPAQPGVQAVEGSRIHLSAVVSDDVQVRKVELLVNGEVVSSDVSFPWDLSGFVPAFSEENPTAVIQVRATDTGGNTTLSDPGELVLLRDTNAPAIVSINPPDGALIQDGTVPFAIRFSEPIATSSFTLDNFQLVDSSGVVQSAASVTPFNGDQQVRLIFHKSPPGDYRLVIHAAAITDRTGNLLGNGDVESRVAVTFNPTLSTSATDADAAAAGVQVYEGTTIPFDLVVDPSAVAPGGVAVALTELLVNGQVVASGATAPVNFSFVSPSITPGASSLTVVARVTDTLGHLALSNSLHFDLLEDLTPPQIAEVVPADGSSVGEGVQALRVRFSESMAIEGLTAQTIQLRRSNGAIVSPVAFQIGNDDQSIQFFFDVLPGDDYTVAFDAPGLRDRAGNVLGNDEILTHFAITSTSHVFIVKNTADDGPDSLRRAIENANSSSAAATIEFAIPASDPGFVDIDAGQSGGDATRDVFVISLLSPLPALNNANGTIVIDGRTQSFLDNSNPRGPEIVLDGTSAGANADGLQIASNGNGMFGLSIRRFSGNGIVITGNGNVLEGNYVGTDAAGVSAAANVKGGILISGGSDNRVGAADSNAPTSETANVIAFNQGIGVSVVGSGATGNSIRGNAVFSNSGSDAIDLGGNGATSNDAGDLDDGPNHFQNKPDIILAVSGAQGGAPYVRIGGTLRSLPNTTYLVDFYATNSNLRQTRRWLGSATVQTDAAGYAEFSPLLQVNVTAGVDFVTATATDSEGNTSELGQPQPVNPPATTEPNSTLSRASNTGLSHAAPRDVPDFQHDW